MQIKKFSETAKEVTIDLQLEIIGRDLLATITGGDTPHIGTITTVNQGEKKITRFPSHEGRFHKDDVLADVLIASIAEQIPGTLVVTAGVHVNLITKEQIQATFPLMESLTAQAQKWLASVTWTEAAIYREKNK